MQLFSLKRKVLGNGNPISSIQGRTTAFAFLTFTIFLLSSPKTFAQNLSCGNAIDYFNSQNYSNQDGDFQWTSDWVEGNDDGTPSGGGIIITNSGFLSMTATSNACRTIERAIDLSAYSEAVLTTKYNLNGDTNGNDEYNIYVSVDGGANFILLDQLTGAGNSEDFLYYDMTPYITNNTVVRHEVCGFGSAGESLDIEFFNVTGCNIEIVTGPCSDGFFRWENAAGTSGYNWTENDQVNIYSVPYSGGNVNMTVTLIDPDNRNSDNDYTSTHPFDPAGGCLPYDGTETDDNPADNGSIIDPWDSDCGQLVTETMGAYGPNYLTWVMYAEDHEEMVTLEFCFDQPALINDFKISDIDYQGLLFSNNINPFEAPGNSYQDEVIVSAIDPYGNNVPVTIVASGSEVIVSGQTAKANYDPNSLVSGDLSPNDINGEIVLNSEGAISCFYLSYSNGPDDAADEQANPQLYDWWSNANGATNGAVDDQAIRIDGFNFCVCPDFDIAVVNDTICEGEEGTVLIQSVQGGISPYSYLWSDGSTAVTYSDSPDSSMIVSSVLITDIQGCTDTVSAFISVENCCPPIQCLPLTVTKVE